MEGDKILAEQILKNQADCIENRRKLEPGVGGTHKIISRKGKSDSTQESTKIRCLRVDQMARY